MNNSAQLKQQFEQLKQRLTSLAIKPESWFGKQDLFNSSAFHTKSDEVADYLVELEGNINKILNIKEPVLVQHLSELVPQQFAALNRLIAAQEVNQHNKNYQRQFKQHLKVVKQLNQRASQNSQSLYQELSKLKEYERRLFEMVEEKQQALNKYSGQKLRAELQQQVLQTQQRLGRCRQAVSKVEEKIQQLDSRN